MTPMSGLSNLVDAMTVAWDRLTVLPSVTREAYHLADMGLGIVLGTGDMQLRLYVLGELTRG